MYNHVDHIHNNVSQYTTYISMSAVTNIRPIFPSVSISVNVADRAARRHPPSNQQ